MTPYEIKNAAHQVAIEGAIVCMRKAGVDIGATAAELGKLYIQIYAEIFRQVEKFLRAQYGYTDVAV